MLICAALIFSVWSSTGAFASEKGTTTSKISVDGQTIEITENKNKRIAKDGESTVIFDKEAEEITFIKKGEEPVTVDLSEALATPDPKQEVSPLFNPDTSEKTWSNYEYFIDQGSTNEWELRRPQPGDELTKYYYFRTNETSSNRSDLNNFKDAVEDINKYEAQWIGANLGLGITAIVVSLISGITAGIAVPTILSSLGLTGTALNIGMLLGNATEDAHYYYFEVYYN